MKSGLPALFLAAIALPAFSQAPTDGSIKDHRTNPDVFFMEMGDFANSLELLLPPPDAYQPFLDQLYKAKKEFAGLRKAER